MRAHHFFPTLPVPAAGHRTGAVLAPRPAWRAQSVPPEPVMPPPPPPDLPTGVPPIGDPLPSPSPSPAPDPVPGTVPGTTPDMPPPMQAQAGQGGQRQVASTVHHPMIAQPARGRAPRYERPSVYRISLQRSLGGPQSGIAH